MTPQELKSSILQLAIQGKLVEQHPEEGTGEELYQKIQTEKQKLIKAGTIKKEKPLPEISEDEIPFDIPDSWKWVRLGDCSSYSQHKEKVSPGSIEREMWSLDLEDIEKETGKIVRRCTASERTIVGDKVRFHKGQVLYSKLRPYLKKVLVAPDDGICSSEIVPFTPYGGIVPQYLVYVLTCPHVDYIINSVTYGVKMPRVGTETMVNLLIPLPSFAEQKRIVAKIEELLPYIDRYEKAWSRLEDFNKRFPVDMQKSILQMAVQGKLVEQEKVEQSLKDIYWQVRGAYKRTKPLPTISEDEIPYDIPTSWLWVRLGDVLIIERGGSPRPIKDYITADPCGINWIKIGDTEKGGKYINGTQEKIIPEGMKKSRYVQKGDFLLSNSMSFGRPYILNIDGCIHDGWLVLRPVLDLFDKEYLYYLLSSPMVYRQFCSRVAGAVVNNLNSDKVALTVVPVPPLAEQKRIVAKLEELLPLCERLK